jgi:hypothetical protein
MKSTCLFVAAWAWAAAAALSGTVLHYATEPNRGRIARPRPDDRLDFAKRIEFAR